MAGEMPAAGVSPGDRRLWTVAEIAGLLRVNKMTVYRLVNSGELRSVRVGRVIRVREGDLRDMLAVHWSEDLAAWMNSGGI